MAYTSCLTDYIGLQGCSATVPDSGVYVNTLPGISWKAVDFTADEEQVTASQVWADVQERGIRNFESRVRAELSKKYKLVGLQHSVDLTKVLLTTTEAASAKYRGVVIDLDNYTTDQHIVSSNFQQINVQTISLYLSGVVNTTYKIFDLIKGTVLKSGSITGVAGWNDVEINEKYTARKIFICYDATSVIGSDLDVEDSCGCFSGCEVRLDGGEANISSSVLESAVTKGESSFGLTSVFTIECTYNALICNNKEIFLNALWYLLGIELLNERLYTTRINRYTTIDQNKSVELKKYFTEMFERELMIAVEGINLNLCDCCIECNDKVQIQECYG